MADDLDAMLQGNDNPSASSAQNSQQGDSTQGNPIEQPTEEEVEFNKLDGKAQDRFKSVWARARQAEEALEAERQSRQTFTPPAPGNQLAPDQRTAIETLSKFGITTDDKLDAKINSAFNQLRWDNEQTRLEGKYTGQNGEPQYVREEMEDYIRKHPQYLSTPAEDVFKLRFIDEFANIKSTQQAPRRSSTLRPTRANIQNDSINPDNVEEMVKAHDDQWYLDHQDEINRAVNEHTKQFTNEGQRV
jgi:hypothetical protein